MARAIEHRGVWLVLVDSKVAERAGLGSAFPAVLDAFSADDALEWVNLIAGLYVKAVAK